MMEYNAASVKFLLWHVETKETAKLLQEHSFDEIRRMVLEDNIYQQKSRESAQSEFSCIKKCLQALPEELIQKLIQSDIQTTKIITFIACMVTDRLLFELMYEVYRNKVHYGEENITDADLNIFMNDKRDQSEKMAGFSIQRFARNTVDLLETVRHLKDIGVKMIFDDFLNGLSAESTEKKLEQMGVKSYKGQHFRNTSIR